MASLRRSALLRALPAAGCARMDGLEPSARTAAADDLHAAQSFADARAAAAAWPATDWWRDFGDEQLDRLECEALAGSPTLRIAQARVARARFFPDVNLAAFPGLQSIGLALIVIWVGALQIMLDKGNELDWFNSNAIVALTIVAALGLAPFVAWELTEAHPIVNLRRFRIRNFRAGTIALALGFGVFFGSVVLLPLWLQTQMGCTASWARLVLAPSGVLAFALSPAVGRNIGRVARRRARCADGHAHPA